MEQIIFKDLKFAYPLSEIEALNGINLTVSRGEFIVICGKSGCGKTTLLRHIKKQLVPAGKRSGEVLFNGIPVNELSERDSAAKIGFVMQNPENQIVTDKVWHELAFGLENLGMDSSLIRLKTAEMAAYFGMQAMFDKRISELSGGQKQLLNLASVMIMNPEVIVFDEPTSQLDPVAAGNFLSTVAKINRDLGITVIMTEHRLEEVLAYADRVIVMDNGRISVDCGPSELSEKSKSIDGFVSLAMPASVRIHSALNGKGKTPLTVGEGAKWLAELFADRKPEFVHTDIPAINKRTNAVEIKNIFFRYEKDGDSILDNFSLNVPQGSVFALMGANGAGKSTLLKIVSGQLKAVSGKIKLFGEDRKKSKVRISALPQNIQAVFTRKTVSEELCEMSSDKNKIAEIAELTDISALLDRHPYDLSGGEQQRAALAKLLLTQPDIILLDEPTKGMDCEFKVKFAEILRELIKQGKTVLMVSHDIEFCSANADFCAMVFDGKAVSSADTNSFFAGNYFYTTSANKMSRHIFKNCITDKDVILLCQKNLKQ